MDKNLIQEISEISTVDGIPLNRNQSNNNPDDTSDFTTVLENQPENTKKSKNQSKSKEGKKRSSALKNPFLIFAKEQRGNIRTGKKGHVSTILGNMWHEMDSSEKKKYFEKAKRPYSEVIASDVLTSDGKSRNKTKKKKEPKPATHPHVGENGVSSSKDTAVMLDKSEKKENGVNIESTAVDPQQPSTSLQQDSKPCPRGSLPQYQHSIYNALRLPQPQSDMNNANLIPYSANMGGFYRPYFYPPDPFWMYQQTMFPHHYSPFTSPYHPHCHCCPMPYHGLGAQSHFRSVIYGRTNAHYTDVSAAGASSDAGNDVKDDSVSDDGENRLVIVDDVDTGEQA